MLNPGLKLNEKLFDGNVEQKPTRDGYGTGLLKAGEDNQNVVALCADLTESTRTEAFAKKFPERYFEMGVAEQNMATIAAGLGVSGKVPFIASYATFSPGRNYEQIRTTIAYNNSNVKIAGHHAGISVGQDGATHQGTEDIAIMRAMPNMKVFVPCDAFEAERVTLAAVKILGPVYLRFGREKSPIVTTAETPFRPGRADVYWMPGNGSGKKADAVIFACGIMVHAALLAAKELEKEKIAVYVVNSHTVKPLDEETVLSFAERTGAVVTAEEHQIAGGLGGAIAELLAKHRPAPMEFVGLKDTFAESGPPSTLLDKYGLSAKDIKAAVKKVLSRK